MVGQPITALARGLKVLEVLSRANGAMGNGQLARATGLPPSTVSRLTDSLVQLGYLRQSQESGAYVLTPKNLRLGYPVLANLPIAGRAQKAIDALADETGMTTALAVRDDLHVAFLVVSRPRRARAVPLSVGGRLPISVSAAGIAFLRSMTEPMKGRATTAVRKDLTQRGQPVEDFDRRLTEPESRAYVSLRSWHSDVGGVATAFHAGGELYALSLVAYTEELQRTDIDGSLVPLLLETTDELAD
ncbi:IclR family transcriptional regulator [Streptomyces sp. NPDC052042]|uniref:IclR family transcriptional regulator n=1 Tax=Streptomyces sp. NPDC052042 TaxID=3365683 RepID=UPI0037D80DA0